VTTTTAPPATTLLSKYTAIIEFLNSQNVERREAIDLVGLSVISGIDVLLLGDPGTGKTWLLELLTEHCIDGAELFTHLLAKDMSADELLGPRDIMAMKSGKIARLMDGYLPTANLAYLDEIFKSSPPLLNPLLDITANRVLKIGGKVVDCSQLISIVMSSNELPDREDLQAFRDRIGATLFVQPVRTPEGRRAVTDIQLDFQTNGINTDALVPLTLDEIHAIRDEVRQVKVSDEIREKMVDAQQKLLEHGHPPSQRRIGQAWKLIKARAWSEGRRQVASDDFLPCQHVFWNHPDNRETARAVVLDIASVFTRKAARLRDKMEPVTKAIEELRTQFEATTDEAEQEKLLQNTFGLMRQVKKFQNEAESQIRDGQTQGEDTTILDEVRDELTRLYEWSEKTFIGKD